MDFGLLLDWYAQGVLCFTLLVKVKTGTWLSPETQAEISSVIREMTLGTRLFHVTKGEWSKNAERPS